MWQFATGFAQWQAQRELGALIGFGLDINVAAVILNDAARDGQAQTGAGDFGRKERVENLLDGGG